MGRFGNQLFQLAFGLGYAREYGAELRIPKDCPLREIFDLDHIGPIDTKLPATHVDQIPFGMVNIDLVGYFQHKIFLSLYSRQDCRKWFRFRPEILERYTSPKRRFVAHLRRGDYVKYPDVFCTVDQNSYKTACDNFWLPYGHLHWVTETSSEDPLFFLQDFLLMVNSEFLLRANSSFSWWAHVLGQITQRIYSPIVRGKLGQEVACDFVEGNWPALISANWPTHSNLYLRESNA